MENSHTIISAIYLSVNQFTKTLHNTLMKQIISVFLLFTLSVTARAQLSKGQWLVGGTADFSHSNAGGTTNGVDNDIKTTSLESSPGGGYFFIDRFCAGLRIGILTTDTKQVVNGRNTPPIYNYYSVDSKLTGLAFSPFARYYFLAPAHKINVFADAGYAYSHNKQKAKTYQEYWNPGSQFPSVATSTSDDKYKAHSFSIAAGPALFLNPKVSLELSLGYRYSKYIDSEMSANDIILGIGFQVHLGKK